MDDITRLKRIKEAITERGSQYTKWEDFKKSLPETLQVFLYEHSGCEAELKIALRNRRYYVKSVLKKKS